MLNRIIAAGRRYTSSGPVACTLLAEALYELGDTAAAVQRYVTLRANEVNLRAGPGEQFPIQWVYRRKGLPVEVIGKSDKQEV